jgi:hypothetical protein
MASTSGRALGRKQIREQQHDDLDSFSEISQVADIDIIEHRYPDNKINRPDLNDSCSNSDDGQVGANVSSDDDGGGDGDDSDKDDDEDWTLWDKMTMISVRYDFLTHLVVNHLETDKCPFLHTNFPAIFNATLFEEIAAEISR